MENNNTSKIKHFGGCFKRLKEFFTCGLWDVDLQQCNPITRGLVRTARMLTIAIKGFIEDNCTLQASALTYITLVTIVPVLAVTLAFCKGIGVQERLMSSIGIEREVLEEPSEEKGATQYRYRIVQAEVDEETPANAAEQGDNASDATTSERIKSVATQFSSLIKGDEKVTGKSAWAASLPAPMQDALIQLFTYVDRTNFAALGVVGLITMLVTVVMSIKKLENNFNSIWCVKRGRSLGRQFSEYLIVLLLTPLALLVVLTLATFLNNGGIAALLPTASETARMWSKIAASSLLFAFVIVSFVFLYIFMPNTKVRIGSAIVGGLSAAIIWGIVLWAYIRWQIGLANFNKIYGSFAALPFFLAWLYANWTVVLLGVEICYSAQNAQILRNAKHISQMAPGACHLLGIVIMNEVCRNFEEGQGQWNAAQFAATHNVSIKEIEAALTPLEQNGFIIRRNINSQPPECYDFVLGMPAEKISLASVSEAYLGISSGDAERIAKCLPTQLSAEIQRHHQHALDDLQDVTFAHEATE